MDEEGIWRFATNHRVLYCLHPDNAIVKSIVFSLQKGRLSKILQNIFQRNALLFKVLMYAVSRPALVHRKIIT